MKILRKMRGITLISLIVTIIILLILAGISIQLIGGSNGILNRASQALDVNDKATATEKMELKITYLNMVSYGENTRKATLQELADGLFADKEVEYVKLKNQEVASLEPIDVTGENSFFVKLKEYSYEFEIDENLQLASVDGVKVATTNPSNDELKKKIEEMQTSIAELQKKNAELEEKYVTKSEMTEAISNISSNSKFSMDVLYSGEASTIGKVYNFTFPQGKSLSDYKLLCFFADVYHCSLGWINGGSCWRMPVVDDKEHGSGIGFATAGTDNVSLTFSVNTLNSFRIDSIFVASEITAARICKVVGIY